MYKHNEDTANIEIIKQFIKCAQKQYLYEIPRCEGIEYIIQNSIDKYNFGSPTRLGIEYIDVILDYIALLMERDPNAITNFGFISHLYQLMQKERHDKELTDKLKQFFNSRIHKEEADITSFEPYKEKLDGFTKMSEYQFESFLNIALDYRNKTGMFPENVCDYIIKQCILRRQNINISREIILRVLEDKAMYAAKEKGNNSTMAVCSKISDNFLSNDKVIGESSSNGLIRLRSNNSYTWFDRKTYNYNGRKIDSIPILNTLFHELRHNVIHEQLEEYYYEPTRYKIFKEDILCRSILGYFEKNYEPLFFESDANIYASIDTLLYLRKLKFTKEELKEAGLLDFEDLVEASILEELSAEKDATIKYDPDRGEYRNFEDIFQDLVKRRANFIFEVNPRLKFEYNTATGKRKGNMRVLEEYQSSRLSEKIYPTIIKNEATLSNETILEDIGRLLEFTPEYPETEKLRNYILREKILPRVREWAEKGKVDLKRIDGLSEEEMEAGEKNQFEIAKDSLIKFARLHPEFSKDIDFLTMPEGEEVSLSEINNLFIPDTYLQSVGNALKARGVLHYIEGNKEKENSGDNKENVEGEGITADE